MPVLLLAAGVSCAPPLQTTTTAPAPTTTASEAVVSTTVGAVITTEAAPEVQEIITGLTEPAVAVTEVTTELPAATTTQEVVAETTTVATTTTTTTTTITTTPPPPPPRLNGKQREALIGHLGNIDLRNTDTLVLTPRQRLAISQELEYQQLGLPAFTDPTPWQRLSREQQEEFNRKYLALRPELQEFSKGQFTSLPEDRQEHAFNMFISLDLKTLTQVIENELFREREAQEQQRQAVEAERRRQQEILRARQEQEQRSRFQEVPRSQSGTNFKRFNPAEFTQQQQQFQQQTPQFRQPQPVSNNQRPNFDPRRRQPVQQQQFQQQPRQQQFQTQFQQQPQQQQFFNQNQFQQQPQAQQQQPQPTEQDLRHFAQAEAQIAEAVRLQSCLANPAQCA